MQERDCQWAGVQSVINPDQWASMPSTSVQRHTGKGQKQKCFRWSWKLSTDISRQITRRLIAMKNSWKSSGSNHTALVRLADQNHCSLSTWPSPQLRKIDGLFVNLRERCIPTAPETMEGVKMSVQRSTDQKVINDLKNESEKAKPTKLWLVEWQS